MRRLEMPDPAQRLARLIEFDTQNPTGDELAICEFLAGELRRLGADQVELREVPRDLPGGAPGGSGVSPTNDGGAPGLPGAPPGRGAFVFARFGRPRLLINAHVDTVPANTGWTRDPHRALITEDRVVGLGSADTKGAIAAALTALETATPRDVAVLFSGDEERGTTCLRAFLDSGLGTEIERAIVCEPTARTAGIRHRGVVALSARRLGRGGHSSRADDMPKPIVELAALAVELDRIGASYRTRGPERMTGICNNIAAIDGGVAFNVVPDAATLTWSIRPYPGFDRAEYDAEVSRAIGSDIDLSVFVDHPPFASRDAAGFEALLGDRVRAMVTLDFWTEAALLSEAGIPAVVLGPGDIAQAHAADEFVDRSDLIWATELFCELVAQ